MRFGWQLGTVSIPQVNLSSVFFGLFYTFKYIGLWGLSSPPEAEGGTPTHYISVDKHTTFHCSLKGK